MERGLLGRCLGVLAAVAFAGMFLVPTVVGEEGLPGWWKGALPSEPVHLGLDLQGGIHMVLEVQVDRAVEEFG